MNYSQVEIWLIIALMAIGTFAIRFSFLGLIGSKRMVPVIERMLRFTPVAVLPGMVAPLVLWPTDAADGVTLLHLAAAVRRRWHSLSDPQGHLGHVGGPRRVLCSGGICLALTPVKSSPQASRSMIHSTSGAATNRHLRSGPAMTLR